MTMIQQGIGAAGVAAWREPPQAAAIRKAMADSALASPQDSSSFSDAAYAALKEQEQAAHRSPFSDPRNDPWMRFPAGDTRSVEEQLAAQSKEHLSSLAGAEERYAAALADGKSVDAWVEEHKNSLDPSGTRKGPGDILEPMTIKEFTTSLYGTGITTVTSKQGTVVSVEDVTGQPPYPARITRSDGLQLNLNVSEDMRINDMEDGSLSLYFPASGKTCIFDPSGAMRVEEGTSAQGGTASDDIIINLKGSVVDGGDGDDTIFNFADNTTINGGDGDDTVFVNKTSGSTISMGSGNDRLAGRAISDSHVDMGEGDNVVSMEQVNGSTLLAGDGNNQIMVNTVTGGTSDADPAARANAATSNITLGNGNNSIMTGSFSNGSQMRAGDGNNTVHTNGISQGSSLLLGQGNNRLTGYGISANSTVDIGNGNNTIDFMWGVSDGSSLHLGDGNNSLEIGGVSTGAELNLGNGNNAVEVRSVFDNSHVTIGDGNNYVSTYSVSSKSTINIGNGENIYVGNTVANESSVSLGNGGNIIWLNGGVFGNSAVRSGSGDDVIHVSYVMPGGSVHAGDGNDVIHAESVTGSMYGGNGDDTLIVDGPMYGTTRGESGNNTVVIGKKALENNMDSISDALHSLRKAQMMAANRYAAQAMM